MEHLQNKKLVEKVCDRLWTVSGCLNGLGGLFKQCGREMCLEACEFFGIGQLLQSLHTELSALEDLIRCGADSTSDARNGLDSDDEE